MEEANRQLLTEYEPIDISSIKLSGVRSEKELEQEATQICDTLRDISNFLSYYPSRGRLEQKTEGPGLHPELSRD